MYFAECCNPDFKDQLGRTALMEAAVFDDVEMMSVLQKGGKFSAFVSHLLR